MRISPAVPDEFPAACRALCADLPPSMRSLVTRGCIPDLHVNGHPEAHLPNTLNVCLPGVDSMALLQEIPELAAATGAACHWGVTEPSAVLTQMGVPRALALGAVRFSLGVGNTEADVDRAAALVIEHVATLRGVNSGGEGLCPPPPPERGTPSRAVERS